MNCLFLFYSKSFQLCYDFIAELHTNVEEAEGVADESVTPIKEISEPGIDTNWLKDNVSLSVSEGKYETINKDNFHESVTPKISIEDTSESQEKSGDLDTISQLAIDG